MQTNVISKFGLVHPKLNSVVHVTSTESEKWKVRISEMEILPYFKLVQSTGYD